MYGTSTRGLRPRNSLANIVDRRYRLVPTFGRTIRRFPENVSEQKRKAARDHEDLLQCAIPVFEGVLPNQEHSTAVISILAVCAEWHTLAKLRMHTDDTLGLLEETTIKLGYEFRKFVNGVCAQVPTKELESEQRKRAAGATKKNRQDATASAQPGCSTTGDGPPGIPDEATSVPTLPEDAAGNMTTEHGSSTSALDTSSALPQVHQAEMISTTQDADMDVREMNQCDAEAEKTQGTNLSSGQGTTENGHGTGKGKGKGKGKTNGKAAKKSKGKDTGEVTNKGKGKPQDELRNGGGTERQKEIDHSTAGEEATGKTGKKNSNGRKAKTLSLSKPKFHFLGDYVKTIRMFGTTDNYSSEGGELMHRHSKRWYKRSSKINPRKEVPRHERKAAHIRALRHSINRRRKADPGVIEEQRKAAQIPDIHHYIGVNENIPVSLLSFAQATDPRTNQEPLVKTFISKLQEHLLPRLTEGPYALTAPLDPTRVCCKNHRIFSHKIMRIKYTSYDVRRSEDVIHLDSDACNILIPNPKYLDDQRLPPYLYAYVLGIYHAWVSYVGEIDTVASHVHSPTRMEFLWVRWYETVEGPSDSNVLECVAFPDVTLDDSTSFVDPRVVLRAAHLIPRFSRGRKYADGKGLSGTVKDGSDWSQYCVNRFADRDMYMRYKIGMAVGHVAVWPSSIRPSSLQSQAQIVDQPVTCPTPFQPQLPSSAEPNPSEPGTNAKEGGVPASDPNSDTDQDKDMDCDRDRNGDCDVAADAHVDVEAYGIH